MGTAEKERRQDTIKSTHIIMKWNGRRREKKEEDEKNIASSAKQSETKAHKPFYFGLLPSIVSMPAIRPPPFVCVRHTAETLDNITRILTIQFNPGQCEN